MKNKGGSDMVRIENDCCSCTADGYPCIGDECFRRHAKHYYCNNCNEETKIYYFNGSELCLECIEKQLEVVE